MNIFEKKELLNNHISALINDKKTIGFVPTMGALHKGHISLVKKSMQNNDVTVVSIFVNPTQFDNKEDLINYPNTLEADIQLLKKNKCDIVFTPSIHEIYASNISSKKYTFDGIENQMEGKFRQGHFDGVATIVQTLFEIAQPHNAYFGEKDFQQLQIIKKLVSKNKLKVNIVGCPIYREKDGLAMSSRNTRLTKEQRKAAPFIYKILKKAAKKINKKTPTEISQWVIKKFDKHPLLTLEYFTIANEKTLETSLEFLPNEQYRAFIAVYADKIRLIDNISLH